MHFNWPTWSNHQQSILATRWDRCWFLTGISWCKGELDPKFPKAYGKPLATTLFVDSSHANNKETGRSITGCIAFVGWTPVSWISHRQCTVETSTYSTEFSALCTAIEESISIRSMLCSLGIPIIEHTKVFGNNLSVILSSTWDSAELKKKHTALSFHMVHEAVAAEIIALHHIPGYYNYADILTKAIDTEMFKGHAFNILMNNPTGKDCTKCTHWVRGGQLHHSTMM